MKKRNVVLVLALLLITNGFTLFFAWGGNGQALKELALETYIEKNYLREVDKGAFNQGKLKGIVAALEDPYSAYFTPEEYQALLETTRGKFYGIGVQIAPGEDNLITVVAPIKGSPADQAGIQSGDKIIKVEDQEVTAEKMDQAVDMMRGEKGTQVQVTLLKKRGDKVHMEEVSLLRDEIKTESVISGSLEGDIGYIGLTSFEEDSSEDFKAALEVHEKNGVKGLVVDLRGNPGGILEEAVAIADLFLEEGNIVYATDKSGKKVFDFYAEEGATDLPLVLLVNQGSASASEILAGALKDHGRGVLIGEKTFGKGVVQTVTPFLGGGGLKLTTSEYFTPAGVNIHGKGIEPDQVISLPEDVEGIGLDYLDQDLQLQGALAYLKKK
ncbi:MAG: S41 family peptidase [Tissierellia bacterium]|nr:S41 family peptidase [Tissierellia bacterium]